MIELSWISFFLHLPWLITSSMQLSCKKQGLLIVILLEHLCSPPVHHLGDYSFGGLFPTWYWHINVHYLRLIQLQVIDIVRPSTQGCASNQTASHKRTPNYKYKIFQQENHRSCLYTNGEIPISHTNNFWRHVHKHAAGIFM